MKAEWLTLGEMQEAIVFAEYRDNNGNPVRVGPSLAKQIAQAIADASKAKADSLA
jgi:hypothetical protein